MTKRSLSGLLVLVTLLVSCTTTKNPKQPSGPYLPSGEVVRNTPEAERLTREAAGMIGDDDDGAESMLLLALGADLFHGPAHNNLGVIYLQRGELYEAAHEFEWARKLMPGHPDPRVNLAMTLEIAGQGVEAVEAYTSALEVYPRYVPAVQGLACYTLRAGLEDGRMAGWLEMIALEGETQEWRQWARRQVALR